MNRLLFSAAFVALLASSVASALAASSDELGAGDARNLCTKLESQYQFLKPFKEGLPYWKTASAEAQKGEQACKSGNAIDGAHDLQSAISDMYVKPDSL
ncbi:hypothetical protein [Parvibaculum sp.]|uniref:hypothetical protein n=1 Tax=Parvibaculum sp. TaxID=2024848 RepID=UPI0032117011